MGVVDLGNTDESDYFNPPTPAFRGMKYYDANENHGRDLDEPGLSGWTIELYADVNSNGIFEPNGPFGVPGADLDPVATAVTDGSGNYFLGSQGLPTGTYFIREVVRSGWKQMSPPPNVVGPAGTYYTVTFTQGTAFPTPLDFGNASCTGTLYVPDGPRVVTAQRDGLLTLVLSQGTMTVTRVDVPGVDDGGNGIVDDAEDLEFDAYNGSGGVLPGVMTVTGQRVDILIGANDYLHAGDHPTPPGTQFTVNISGSNGVGTLTVLNAVNVDVAGSLALQITGTECGELIAVGDDKADGQNSDAKAIYFGTVEGVYNGGANLSSQGIEYDKAIMDAMFGSPSISRVEVAALAGDDIVRVKDEINQQQMLNAGDGDDTVRSGSGKSQVFGGAGIDLLVGGAADDVIYGDAGHDRIFAGAGDDRVFGGLGDDWIAGFLGNDSLLKGEDGNDRISGGAGRDRLYGDAGTDIGYRDAADLLVYQVETVNSTPPDPVEQALLDLVTKYWDDLNADARDTLDELINWILP
jgi:Ca2+-binding RTX toxin-like protein